MGSKFHGSGWGACGVSSSREGLSLEKKLQVPKQTSNNTVFLKSLNLYLFDSNYHATFCRTSLLGKHPFGSHRICHLIPGLKLKPIFLKKLFDFLK